MLSKRGLGSLELCFTDTIMATELPHLTSPSPTSQAYCNALEGELPRKLPPNLIQLALTGNGVTGTYSASALLRSHTTSSLPAPLPPTSQAYYLPACTQSDAALLYAPLLTPFAAPSHHTLPLPPPCHFTGLLQRTRGRASPQDAPQPHTARTYRQQLHRQRASTAKGHEVPLASGERPAGPPAQRTGSRTAVVCK
jgi:hypothetical protein